MRLTLAAGCVLFLALWTGVSSETLLLPRLNGMAIWGDHRFVVVRDLKERESGERLALIRTRSGLSYQPVRVDWSSLSLPANDVEAISPLAGRPDEFLAAEAGYVSGRYGRLFWLALSEEGDQPRGRVLGTFALPQLPQEVEGLATLALSADEWLVFFGGRGGNEGQPARIYWARLHSQTGLSTDPAGMTGVQVPLPRRLGPFARTLSDMFVDEQGTLWAAAHSSTGPTGPYRSMIYEAGTLSTKGGSPYLLPGHGQKVWWVDGFRIKGLAPSGKKGFGPAFVTDEDTLGGIWRAVPASPSLNY